MTYPETAAAGLWTTPSDLARFVMAMQRSLAGRGDGLLSSSMARAALRAQRNHMGLGFFLQGEGHSLRFDHSGRNQGFDSEMVGYAEGGRGAVVLLNANDSAGTLDRILQYVGEAYHWPNYPRLHRPPPTIAISPEEATTLAGHYGDAEGGLLTLLPGAGEMIVRRNTGRGAYYDALRLDQRGHLVGADHPVRFVPVRNAAGRPVALDRFVEEASPPRRFTRLGALAKADHDPDPSLAARLLSTLRRLATNAPAGDEEIALSDGFTADIGGRALAELGPVRGLLFAGAEEVPSPGVARHRTSVARTRTYLLRGAGTTGAIVAYFDAADRLCDYDLVGR